MSVMHIEYSGDLRTQATHLSGASIITDAPVDNHGRGEAFSPTDLLCTSLGTCMMTIMAIEAKKLEVSFENVKADVRKFMLASPRRVGKIHVMLFMPRALENHPHREKLEQAGINCPVALSIHPDIEKQIEFKYEL